MAFAQDHTSHVVYSNIFLQEENDETYRSLYRIFHCRFSYVLFEYYMDLGSALKYLNGFAYNPCILFAVPQTLDCIYEILPQHIHTFRMGVVAPTSERHQ